MEQFPIAKIIMIILCFFSILVLTYLFLVCSHTILKEGLLYKQKPETHLIYCTFYYGLAMGAFILYTGSFFLTKGQNSLAHFSLRGSLIVLMLAGIMLAESLHELHGKVPWISNGFYYAAGGSFAVLLFHPWEISYKEGLGYYHSLSHPLTVLIIIQIAFLCLISWQTLRSIKKQLLEELAPENKSSPSMRRKKELMTKKQLLDRLIYCYTVGALLIALGLFPGTIFLDALGFIIVFLGLIIVFLPQAYILTKDKEILLFLSTKRIKEGLRHLEKQISTVAQQYEDKAQQEKQFWIEVVNNLIEKFPELKA